MTMPLLNATFTPSRHRDAPSFALHATARLWFMLAVCGQLLFLVYVGAVYGGALLRADLPGWNKVVAHAYVPGDIVGNLVFALHMLAAFIVTAGGPLQLIPQLRRAAPAFHRWNGRVYVTLALMASLAGLWLIWVRGGTSGDLTQHLGSSGNAVLIMLCAVNAVRCARAGELARHRRWAVRLFLAVSGVWFFRIGVMFWIAVNGGPVGFNMTTFTGPALNVLSFAQYLLPLAALELYLRAQTSRTDLARFAVAILLLLLTLMMVTGIVVAGKLLWLPHLA